MSALMVMVAVACLVAAMVISLGLAFTGNRGVVEEQFADLAVKMRVAQGALEDAADDENVLRMVLLWTTKRLPQPKSNTPEGEKLSSVLTQAGYYKSSAAATFQAIRILAAIALAVLGLVGSNMSLGEGAGAREPSQRSFLTFWTCWSFVSRQASAFSRQSESSAPNVKSRDRKSAQSLPWYRATFLQARRWVRRSVRFPTARTLRTSSRSLRR
jgi:hypothetical protein